MNRHMITVLINGINDVNTLLDYYAEADNQEDENWYLCHAKKKAEEVLNDYSYVRTRIGLDQEVEEGNEIAEAFHNHLDNEIMRIKNRMNMP